MDEGLVCRADSKVLVMLRQARKTSMRLVGLVHVTPSTSLLALPSYHLDPLLSPLPCISGKQDGACGHR